MLCLVLKIKPADSLFSLTACQRQFGRGAWLRGKNRDRETKLVKTPAGLGGFILGLLS